jgi:quercetin dioxygenase-like cupin family protein
MGVRAVVSEAGGGHRWEMEPGRQAVFRVLSGETGGATAVFEESVPPGAGTPLHIHHPSDELILVRSGVFTFRIGDESRKVEAGGWVFVPRGLVHGWRNTGSAAGDLSFVFVPAAGAVCFEELRAYERVIPDIPQDELIAVFTKHGYELVSFDW